MTPALTALLTQTVQTAPYLGVDAYGSVQYGPAVARAARLEHKVQMQPSPQGLVRVQQTRLFLDGALALDARDQLTLPDGTQPQIQVLYAVPALDGTVDHYECWL